MQASRLSGLRAAPATDNAKELRSSIVDFLCEEARLVVELDGGQHAECVAKDAARTDCLKSQQYSVVRFWNNDVLQNTGGVLETLLASLPLKR